MTASHQASEPLHNEVTIFRAFNRHYTRFLGALDEQLLGSGYSLAEARVLYELANRHEPTAKSLIAALGLDPGYLSRILAAFQRKGLLKRATAKDDARSSILSLTAKGKTTFSKLNALSNKQAIGVLSALSATVRTELLRSMSSIESILTPNTDQPSPFTLRTHRVGDMGEVVRSEALGYAQQFGWDNSFEALVAKIVADFVTHFNPEREHCWIAAINGAHVGHIFLVQHPNRPDTAKLRLLFVDPAARGLRLGETLVNECISFARSAGYQTVTLWTQNMLSAAHRIYTKAGFRLVSEEPHHSFGHDLIGQEWELDLTSPAR
jgi:DNA-binding MarR family transcriptional regulator/GNAT superfamily N-acetyltransferase